MGQLGEKMAENAKKIKLFDGEVEISNDY